MIIDHCDWSAPGHNPYMGSVPQAIESYKLPKPVELLLKEKMKSQKYDDLAEIRSTGITGQFVDYTDLREMHSGKGIKCKTVSINWTPDQVERALIYCEGEYCIAVPTVCRNVSLITRVPRQPTTPPVTVKSFEYESLPEMPAPVPGPLSISVEQIPDYAIGTPGYTFAGGYGGYGGAGYVGSSYGGGQGHGVPYYPPTQASPVPEPTPLLLTVLGLCFLLYHYRKQRHGKSRVPRKVLKSPRHRS